MVKFEKDETIIAGAQPAKVLQEGQDRLLGPNDVTEGSNEAYSGAESSGQTADSERRPSEEDM